MSIGGNDSVIVVEALLGLGDKQVRFEDFGEIYLFVGDDHVSP